MSICTSGRSRAGPATPALGPRPFFTSTTQSTASFFEGFQPGVEMMGELDQMRSFLHSLAPSPGRELLRDVRVHPLTVQARRGSRGREVGQGSGAGGAGGGRLLWRDRGSGGSPGLWPGHPPTKCGASCSSCISHLGDPAEGEARRQGREPGLSEERSRDSLASKRVGPSPVD